MGVHISLDFKVYRPNHEVNNFIEGLNNLSGMFGCEVKIGSESSSVSFGTKIHEGLEIPSSISKLPEIVALLQEKVIITEVDALEDDLVITVYKNGDVYRRWDEVDDPEQGCPKLVETVSNLLSEYGK